MTRSEAVQRATEEGRFRIARREISRRFASDGLCYRRRSKHQTETKGTRVAEMTHKELHVRLPKLQLPRVILDSALKQLLDQDNVGALDFPLPSDIVEVGLSRIPSRFLRTRGVKTYQIRTATLGAKFVLKRTSFSSSAYRSSDLLTLVL